MKKQVSGDKNHMQAKLAGSPLPGLEKKLASSDARCCKHSSKICRR
jgi:hypothetical protein